MMTLVSAIGWMVVVLLGVLFARRVVVLVASTLPRRDVRADDSRSIALIVAAHNEAAHITALLGALERLVYPSDRVQVVLVSDGSTDETVRLMRAWSSGPFRCEVVELTTSVGKGAALAAGVMRAAPSDLVVALDADCEPQPDALRWLSGAFDDERVGGASGYPRPSNADVSTVSRYAALERWVHHLVWLAGKDRLGMDPSLIGVLFAVRRRALEQVGGFPEGRLTEDIDLGAALVEAGWRLRWIGEAVARENVVTGLAAFRTQRNRWTRGLLQGLSRVRSWEQLFVALGYLDRVALLAALVLAASGVISVWWPLGYLAAPFVTLVAAMRRGGAERPSALLRAALVMAVVDVSATVRSVVGAVLATPVRWGRRG
jgi:cellulose synthase/poly-beta-1,6-N-acetylglucosamine synthase-like glycosyltransferase